MAATVNIGGCCCPASPPYQLCDICEGTCPSGQLLPCVLCIEIVSLTFTSTIPGCGPLTVDPLPKPWIDADNVDDRPLYYVSTVQFQDTLTDAGGPYRYISFQMTTPCSGGAMTGDLAYYLGDPDCGSTSGLDGKFFGGFEIETPDPCDLTPLYGEHTFEIPNAVGLPDITAELVIVIAPGSECGIDTDCCAAPTSQVLRGDYFTPPSTAILAFQLEWNGTLWEATARQNFSADPGLDTAAITLECVGGVWHLTIDGYFDEDASLVNCDDEFYTLITFDDGTDQVTVQLP